MKKAGKKAKAKEDAATEEKVGEDGTVEKGLKV